MQDDDGGLVVSSVVMADGIVQPDANALIGALRGALAALNDDFAEADFGRRALAVVVGHGVSLRLLVKSGRVQNDSGPRLRPAVRSENTGQRLESDGWVGLRLRYVGVKDQLYEKQKDPEIWLIDFANFWAESAADMNGVSRLLIRNRMRD